MRKKLFQKNLMLLCLVSMTAFISCNKNEKNDPNGSKNGYEWVDLGLSVKWATCNVGASSPEEFGLLYAWGETEPKTEYTWANYKWWDCSLDRMTKYCFGNGDQDNKFTLDAKDDAAYVNMGKKWRTPTSSEWAELGKCNWYNTTKNGVEGYLIIGPNRNHIFLPTTCYSDYFTPNVSSFGYMTSSIHTEKDPDERFIGNEDFVYIGSDSKHYIEGFGRLRLEKSPRYRGYSVRAVCK